MNIWLDIDNPKYIPFYKALIDALKEKKHTVTITAQNSKDIKKTLKQYGINAKIIGIIFSVFGLFLEQVILLRTALLSNYIGNRPVDIAFSLGSEPILFTCVNDKLPIVSFLENVEEKVHPLSHALEKSFFIFPDSVPEQMLVDKKFDLDKVARCKEKIKKDDLNPDIQSINEVINKIEFFANHITGKLKG